MKGYLPIIIIYLVIVVGIGVYFTRYVKDVEDFALAGRRLSTPVLVGTLFATYIGGATVVGFKGVFG